MFPDVMALLPFGAVCASSFTPAVSVLPNELTYASRIFASFVQIFFGIDAIRFKMHRYSAGWANFRAHPASLAEKVVYSDYPGFAVSEHRRVRTLNPALEARYALVLVEGRAQAAPQTSLDSQGRSAERNGSGRHILPFDCSF
jgi:hypothetical protein